MRNKNMSSLVYAVIGTIGLLTGIVATKHQEKRYREEAEELEKEAKALHDYASALGEITELYKNEVEEMSALADDVLNYIEESEKDLDEDEEL